NAVLFAPQPARLPRFGIILTPASPFLLDPWMADLALRFGNTMLAAPIPLGFEGFYQRGTALSAQGFRYTVAFTEAVLLDQFGLAERADRFRNVVLRTSVVRAVLVRQNAQQHAT